MRYLRFLVLAGIFLFSASYAHAQRVVVGVGIGGPAYAVGTAPMCPYGYYGYYPYACAPYGYYGQEWFTGGVFIGAGPWFHGYYGHRGYGFYGPRYYGHGYGFYRGGGREHFGREGFERGFREHGFRGGHEHGDFRSGGRRR